MFIKSNLNFRGNKHTNEITFHKPGSLDKDAIIEVDNFDKMWDFFKLLNSKYSTKNLDEWKTKYLVNEEEFSKIREFLKDNGMIYKNLGSDLSGNYRTENFFNNIFIDDVKSNITKIMTSKKILVIGVGTVGTSVVRHLLQFGVKQFVIFDGDTVEDKNIIHQHFYNKRDIGNKKVAVIKKRIREISNNVKIEIIPEYFSGINQVTGFKGIDAVFCCFDGKNNTQLEMIYNHFTKENIPVYISGYVIGMVKAIEVDREALEKNEEYEQKITHQINDNAGIGVMGDLASMVMCRLWLQRIIPSLDNGLKELSYDFFTVNSEVSDSYKSNKNNFSNFDIIVDAKGRKYFEEYKVYPYALNLYKEYIITQDENKFSEIVDINNQFSLELIDSNEMLDEYEKLLGSLQVDYNNMACSMEEFVLILLKDDNIPEESIEQYNRNQEKLIEYSVDVLKNKKKKYYSEIEKTYKEKEDLKIILLKISKELTDLLYDKGEIDYEKYKPYSGYMANYSQAFELISTIDKSFVTTNITEFLNYMRQHDFIHKCDNDVTPICIWNSRYGSSEIVINYRNSGNDLMTFTHEIGHAYYNSFLSKGYSEEYLNPLVSEVLAIMTEFKLILTFLENERFDKAISDMLSYRIYGALVGVFSLDLYEEEIL